MRKVIETQLKRCQFADLSKYDNITHTFHIPRYSLPKYELNKMYLIRIHDIILNNHDSALATNWNFGSAPSTQYLKIYVSKVLGKMIYIDSIGYDYENYVDLSNSWSGWLPTEEIDLIATL